MLASNQYYSNKVEQHKTHIDKLYTTTEWLVMEKRRINNEMDEIAESYVKHNEFDEYKQFWDKDLRLLKNRWYANELELRKTDNYIEK